MCDLQVIHFLLHNHLTIISAKQHFNLLCGFWQEDFLNYDQSGHIIGPGDYFEFLICTKNINLIKDQLPVISGKIGRNLISFLQKLWWKCEIPIGTNAKFSRIMAAILKFRLAYDLEIKYRFIL